MAVKWIRDVPIALGVIALAIGVGMILDGLDPVYPDKPCGANDPPICWGNEKILRCVGGTWLEQPCRGSQGCSGKHKSNRQGDSTKPAVCDTSANVAGDACAGEPPRCHGTGVLACVKGALARSECPNGCKDGTCRP
jgi:hypothetical protein